MIVTEIKEIDYLDCMPQNPLQLMWLNSLGGMDTWVFSRHQEFSASVSDVDQFEPVVNYLQIANSNQKVLNKELLYVLNLGYEQLNTQQVFGISQILSSALVYANFEGYFVQVIVKAGSYKIFDTGESRHKLEFDIIFPKQYTSSL
jgi:hypothetical protein